MTRKDDWIWFNRRGNVAFEAARAARHARRTGLAQGGVRRACGPIAPLGADARIHGGCAHVYRREATQAGLTRGGSG